MITEDYVSLEVAELLKEKGFDETFDEVAWKYAEKEAAKKVDKEEFNDYLLQHIFDGGALYTSFKEGAKWMAGQFEKIIVQIRKKED